MPRVGSRTLHLAVLLPLAGGCGDDASAPDRPLPDPPQDCDVADEACAETLLEYVEGLTGLARPDGWTVAIGGPEPPLEGDPPPWWRDVFDLPDSPMDTEPGELGDPQERQALTPDAAGEVWADRPHDRFVWAPPGAGEEGDARAGLVAGLVEVLLRESAPDSDLLGAQTWAVLTTGLWALQEGYGYLALAGADGLLADSDSRAALHGDLGDWLEAALPTAHGDAWLAAAGLRWWLAPGRPLGAYPDLRDFSFSELVPAERPAYVRLALPTWEDPEETELLSAFSRATDRIARTWAQFAEPARAVRIARAVQGHVGVIRGRRADRAGFHGELYLFDSDEAAQDADEAAAALVEGRGLATRRREDRLALALGPGDLDGLLEHLLGATEEAP